MNVVGREVTPDIDAYSPLQPRGGITEPTSEDFPPARVRVPQDPDPYDPRTLGEHPGVYRVTYQGDDLCNLRCPGCFTGGRLWGDAAVGVVAKGGRKSTPHEHFIGQIEALGGLADFFLIGAEPTVLPEASAAKLRYAHDQGIPHMSITNGAVRRERFLNTFGEALQSPLFYKLNISLDSMDKEVNNQLRGRAYAFDHTLETIQHCVSRGAPVKVQMTIWPLNYSTILPSVEKLFELGVRSFAFHSGSLEGVEAPEEHGLAIVDPLAWRALAEELLRFKDENREELEHFNVPFLYFTEDEVRERVIGDDDDTDAYLDHVEAMKEGRETTKPVHVCPALGAPQVYLFGNAGRKGQGAVSLCNIHFPDEDVVFAEYEPDSRTWEVVQDPERNQMNLMRSSDHLCPATPYALGWESDQVDTSQGQLYAACRYVSSNQMPVTASFGQATYTQAAEYYDLVREALGTYPVPQAPGEEWPIQRIERLTAGALGFPERTALLREDLDQ